ncbi:MAG: peptidoglycan editing factor PgeF [Gammaproteobacteria bacterium]|nr:peptidoglycan editing factor PgeF [Gammaproteobacteria bacterium]
MTSRTLSNWLFPDWDAPDNVVALTTTRLGGVSVGDYADFNLATHVGDESENVRRNRTQLLQQLQQRQQFRQIGDQVDVQWLDQVHGTEAVQAQRGAGIQQADAVFTSESGLACCVLTADCLPVLLAARSGHAVAAVHAGWRGLAAGVLENTISRFPTSGDEILAWLGPAIGPCHFQVGIEVREAFLDAVDAGQKSQVEDCFSPDSEPDRYRADLYRLATFRLQALGVKVSGGGFCTFCDAARFYSFRRQNNTGRMASLIYLKH